MKKRKALSLFASVLLAGGVLAACADEKAEEKESTATEETETADEKEEVAEALAVETQVTAYNDMKTELEKMKEDQKVDWDVVNTIYTEKLQAEVNKIDETGEFDQAISAAITAGKNGELEQNIARQIIDKVTQSYFYQKQKSLHKDVVASLEAGKKDEAKTSFEEIKHLANELFIPTAVKRDEYYQLKGEQSLEQNINAGIAAQEEALNNENVEDFQVFKQLTDKSIYRSYYLAANSYAEKIGKGIEEGTEEAELKIEQAEAWGFLQAIKGSLAGGDEEAATKLNELFSLDQTDVKTINAEEVDQLFTKAILGKAKGYHEKTAKALEAGEKVEARVEALEGNMFTKMIELELLDVLGEEKTKEVFEHAQSWFDAVTAENAEEAKTHSEAVLTLLQELE
ncbi:hypothetical protein [Bacillus sp. FJAT-47783]|uniref:hypothetical protein n=1 Tax=Bacillus sp. FJAT-47783 TaxID=2922712 RepID=UPI001FAC0D82|nr:hypothetical protein [Bacillus sp. FJAT-47783]